MVILFLDLGLEFSLHLCRPSSTSSAGMRWGLCAHTHSGPPHRHDSASSLASKQTGDIQMLLLRCWFTTVVPVICSSEVKAHPRVFFVKQKAWLTKSCSSKRETKREGKTQRKGRREKKACIRDFMMSSILTYSYGDDMVNLTLSEKKN
jgi:hypothetical protein